ncbi:iron uptake system protein EfeO [Paenibacillus glycanilyticus]|uniref:Efem/EfeO family lipoprotein n=1 Tax=Paenibacillus glycanilyticus TaxID=126569 RepID=A0ABQ6GCD8_9BACL|nr:iron uptake system protein EfeO [Paenibacillus glycanilyticus]GLX66933.1 Efem/EfeO family lipoprotein [Paenibacillus glycanilyticus]
MKKSITLSALVVATALTLSACGNNDTAKPENTEQSQAPAKDHNAIQEGTAKLQGLTTQLQDAITKQDTELVKSLGKSINDAWLSYENAVRQTYPLEYTDVEKYEMPIFSASAYDKIDFNVLTDTASKLQDALTALLNAKESSGESSEILTKAVANYKLYVEEQTDNLTKQTALFADAVKSGDVERAKQEYAKARVFYEEIEPIAESFGELDPKIDARIGDVEDVSAWTGFHRIEKALWEDHSLEGMSQVADQLVIDTKALQEQAKSYELDPKLVVAGAMELLNEAATSKITGEEEIYSHLDLVDFAANVNGSKTVYLSIIPALNEKNPELGNQLDQSFQQLEGTLRTHQTNGQYIAYDKLSTEEIRVISDQLSELSNLMSQTASIL